MGDRCEFMGIAFLFCFYFVCHVVCLECTRVLVYSGFEEKRKTTLEAEVDDYLFRAEKKGRASKNTKKKALWQALTPFNWVGREDRGRGEQGGEREQQ